MKLYLIYLYNRVSIETLVRKYNDRSVTVETRVELQAMHNCKLPRKGKFEKI